MNQNKCTNCGSKDHIAKFCCEKIRKVPATVKLSTDTTKQKKEQKIIEKGEKLIKKEEVQDQPEQEQEQKKKIPSTKYLEDQYIGKHTQIWGSYWNEVLGWGFACCYSNQKTSECLGEKGKRQSLTKEYVIKRQIEETPLAEQELKSGPINLNELYRKSNLREGAPVDIIFGQNK